MEDRASAVPAPGGVFFLSRGSAAGFADYVEPVADRGSLTDTVRQTGSLLGIAVGGTIMSIAYRRGIEPALHDYPGPVRERARISAEQARHAATALHRPSLAHAADDAFVHAMNVSAIWTMLIALRGAAVLMTALRPARKSRSARVSTAGPRAVGRLGYEAPRCTPSPATRSPATPRPEPPR